MNLSYIEYNKCKDKKKVKKIYIESFKKNERFSFCLLKKCAKEGNVLFNIIYDEKALIGFQYIINFDDISYLMYFAIDKKNRNKGYGSELLKQLSSKNKNILLSIEKPSNGYDITYKRKHFYLKNGFKSTNKFLIDNDVEYELLCNNEKIEVNEKIMKKRYTCMTSSKIIRYIISKIFNVNNIEIE